MRVTSRIKTIFNDELLRYTAAICDTRRIESTADKMIMLGDLLYTYGIDFEILGGATNRIALQIDGYAVKFAMDEQGYLDNLIEYSLSPELQPYVTKSFETNGYILIAECVETITTEEKFRVHRYEILKILDALSQDYLLGDVGYIAKNMTNWGLRNGTPVILDYAYCHRATENLFTCSCCGQLLMYNDVYDKLMCTDRSGCKMIYTYNERKRIQGRTVDDKMIAERKADSIRMQKGETSKDIELFQDRLLGDNYFIIDNPGDLYRYEKLKEELVMNLAINCTEEENAMDKFSAMVRLAKNPNDAEAKKVLYQDLGDDISIPEPVYTDHYQDTYAFGYVPPMTVYQNIPREMCLGEDIDSQDDRCDDGDQYDDDCGDSSNSDSLIRMLKAARDAEHHRFEEAQRSAEDAYLNDLKTRREAEAATEENVEELVNEKTESEQVIQEESSPAGMDSVGKRHDDIPAVGGDAESCVESESVYNDEDAEEDTTGITINGKALNVGEEVELNVG